MIVFMDTVGLLAIWDQSDQWHKAAHACFGQLLGSHAELITTTFVLLECGNASARRPYRASVNRLRKQLENGNRLVTPTADDWQKAWLNYENSEAAGAGIVDHISFVVMRRLGITTASPMTNIFAPPGWKRCFEFVAAGVACAR